MIWRLRLPAIRPIERDYGSATSGANEAASARGLLGTKESGGEDCARPAGNPQGDEGEAQEASSGRCDERSVARLGLPAALPRKSAR